MKKILLGALAVIVVVAGCAAAAHLKALQPRAIPASPPLTIPETVAIRQPAFQRGIDVDAYTYPRHDFSAAAAAVVAYARSLNANSLSISIPFFMSGRYSSRVFASYRRFLTPYARMAEANKVGEFIVGAEFARFGESPRWNRLDRALAKVFHGQLAYSNNDTRGLSRRSGGRAAVKTIDAYHPIHPPFLRGWKSFDRHLPAHTVLTEVSIAALDGAWRQPWVHRSQAARFNPLVQARWFTAACHAALATGLNGIYFWALPLSTRFPRPTPATPGAWAHSPGSAAIARCFGNAQ